MDTERRDKSTSKTNHTSSVMQIKRESKYIIIYNWLSNQIKNKKFLPGDKIPNEIDIAKKFNVHRMTVRQAIDMLVNNHMLIRIRGKGTFLLSEKTPVLTRSLRGISSYYDDIINAGLTPRYKTLTAMLKEADEYIAKKLEVSLGSPIIYLKRLMLADDTPLILERCYLPEELFPDLLEKNTNNILYKLIREEYGMMLMRSQQELGAVIPAEHERKLLKINNNCACIWAEGTVYNDNGRAVEFTHSIYRGDKYRFNCDIGNYIYHE